jgi:hypothetical protein
LQNALQINGNNKMTAINFPSTPTTGQIFTTDSGLTYRYDGTAWTAINSTYATGGFRKLDDISDQFDGVLVSFTLEVDGTAVTLGNEQNVIIVIGGVPQEPLTAYTVATSTITFSSAPTAGMSFYGVLLGDVMNVGVPSDGTVSTIKIVDGAVTTAKLDSNISINNLSYTGTLTGSTGVLNVGSGQLYKDASGNLGLGVTPSAWYSGYKAIQIAAQGTISSDTTANGALEISCNSYRQASSAPTYIGSYAATLYMQYRGEHRWYNAPSGTAGAAISFTQAMTLDASGNLGIGSTSNAAGSRLYVDNSITTNYNGTIAMRYNVAGSTNSYYKGLTGTSLETGGSARGLHLFNYDQDSNNGIKFWPAAYPGSGATGPAVTIDPAGRLTVPNQPAFDAVPPANYTLNGGDQIIAGTWSEMTDRNNNFNPANGTFTAPVAGFYHFTWSSFVTSTSTRNDAYINVNGSIRVRSEISGYAAGTSNRSSMVSVSTYLAANDNVTVGIYISGTGNTYVSQTPWGRFSGFLVG